jgi:hypothetical protein
MSPDRDTMAQKRVALDAEDNVGSPGRDAAENEHRDDEVETMRERQRRKGPGVREDRERYA